MSALLVGCGVDNYTPYSTQTPTAPPAIVAQPSSITVPIGLDGTFTVTVSGGGIQTAQWFINGVSVPGATSLQYTTPTVSAASSGEVFTVTVFNSLGSVTSEPATLTAGARAPAFGDLRFQQVDSLATVNGYSGNVLAHLIEPVGTNALYYPRAFGGPLWIASGQCGNTPTPSGLGCQWAYEVNNTPVTVSQFAVGYFEDFYSNFANDVSRGVFPDSLVGGGSLFDPHLVITSLSINNVNNLFALSFMWSELGAFNFGQGIASPTQFQAAATQAGQASRVITALAFDSGRIIYFSYGIGAATTVYETQTAIATAANAGAVATSLAAQGYIITAMGGDDINGIVMVGTRLQGDTAPRQILIAAPGPDRAAIELQIQQQGYAVVGAIETQSGDITTLTKIGER